MEIVQLESDRLILRQWRDADKADFARINADPEVMKYYPNPLTSHESDALYTRASQMISQQGWGFWAAESRVDGRFMGFVGLNKPSYDLPFNPCVEIGWRLGREFWGKGCATEAARLALEFGFLKLELSEVVSFATTTNRRSIAVMERLGMKDSGENFPHPAIPDGSPLKEHVLYRISRKQWQASL